MEVKELMTVKEVAEFLRVTPSTIRKMVKQGRLKFYPQMPYPRRNRLRFKREDVYAFLKERAGETTFK